MNRLSFVRRGGAALAAFALIAWTGRSAAEELEVDPPWLGPTEISDEPWDPSLMDTRVIYGSDDRIDVYQETDPLRRHLSRSACGLLSTSQLTDNGNGTFSIFTSAYTVAGLPPCPGEPFASQPTAPFCTGFLVAPNMVATAGHCYSASDLSTVRFVFGFQMQGAFTPVTTVSAANVYRGIAVVGRVLTGTLDYTVVQLDRNVTVSGAQPLPIRRNGTVPLNTPLGVMGHPSGLPLKHAFGPTTKVYANGATHYFEANLDTYGGNSGSPVFNASTGYVEGILVRGATDFILQQTCFESNELPDSSAAEEATKTTSFSGLVPQLVFASQVYVDFTSGAPGTGVLNTPYRSVEVGLFRVANGGTIVFKGNTAVTDSPTTLTIAKPVTLDTINGSVRIGVSGARSVTSDSSQTGFISGTRD